MGKMNPQGIKELKAKAQQQKDELKALIQIPFDTNNSVHIAARERVDTSRKELSLLMHTPFDINNPTHIDAIKKYNTSFALTVNKRYLYQYLSEGFNRWAWGVALGVSWVGLPFSPIPNFVSQPINYLTYFYLGLTAASYFLEQAGTTDFLGELETMETLYNWSLKNGETHYSPTLSNTEKLEHPVIQEMVTLLAPICDVDFLRVWPEIKKTNEAPSTYDKVSNIASTTYNTVAGLASIVSRVGVSTYGFFSGTPAVERPVAARATSTESVKRLKEQVEGGELVLSQNQGVAQAYFYFTSNPQFREMLKETVVGQFIDAAARAIPAVVNTARHLKLS